MTEYADPKEVKSFAAGLTSDHLQCRTIGHRWTPFNAEWKRQDDAYLVTYLCDRCSTTRTQSLDRRGDVVRGQYTYEAGYEHKGMGRIVGRGRSALRLENLTRLLGSQTPHRRAARANGKEKNDGS